MARKSARDPGTATQSRLRIGAVSRLTRIPVDTLRVWERRYAVVAPDRELSAVRLYDQDDVERLMRIKQLVERGHAIGSVANLPRAELDRLLALKNAPAGARDARETVEALCYSESLPTFELEQVDGVTVLGRHRSWTAFESAVTESVPEALVMELAALLPERVDEILRLFWRSAALRIIVCYGFAPAALVRRLESEGVIALQSPVTATQILRELRGLVMPGTGPRADQHRAAEPRMFDDAAMVELARLSTHVECECPRHLVGIIRSLNEFEFYSANCEHRNSADATVHAKLRETTAQARALMERALLDVAVMEGVPLPAGIPERHAAAKAERA